MIQSDPSDSAPSIKTRFTRLGLHFLFVALFAMLGGSIRGLNLLLVLAGLMVGALFIQWRWCRRSIENLRVRREIPDGVFADQPFQARFQLTNTSRWLPAWLLRIEDRIDRQDGGATSTASTTVDLIPGGQTATGFYRCKIARRGQYRFDHLTVSSFYPLCLTRSILTDRSHALLDVYPERVPLHRNWERRLLARSEGNAAGSRRRSINDGEFFGLRPWQSGDTPRLIHWRTSARIGELAVRQFEQRHRLDACLLVDAFSPAPGGTTPDDDPAELAFSIAASMLIPWLTRAENRLVLAVAGEQTEVVAGQGSNVGLQRMMSALARATSSGQPQLAQTLTQLGAPTSLPRYLIVLSPRCLDDAVDGHRDVVARLRGWSRPGRLRWIDVSDPVQTAPLADPELIGSFQISRSRQSKP